MRGLRAPFCVAFSPVSTDHPPAVLTSLSTLKLALLLWVVAALILLPVAAAFSGPGFIDAYYYYHIAANLAAGRGFVEDVIWIYLTAPPGIPHPSNLYWMPLTSILAAGSFAVLGESFRAAQLPFVLLSATAPAATFAIARQLGLTRFKAVAAALLLLFSGFYLAYWVAIDSFAPFTLASLAVCAATGSALIATRARRALFLGALVGAAAGVAHLARADGPLLLVAAALVLLAAPADVPRPRRWQTLAAAVAVYLVVMTPWLLRNVAVAGMPLPGGGLQTLFLREYNEIFSYGLQLDLQWYLGQGLAGILEGKAHAALRNLAVLFGLAYWLAPFAAIGWWRFRRVAWFYTPLIYGVLLYLVMTLLFTFPSGRGSMLHSGVALLPWLCIAATEGIEVLVYWIGGRLSHWDPPVAACNVTLIFLAGSLALSGYLVYHQSRIWGAQVDAYAELAPALFADQPRAVPLLLNPTGWWYLTRRPALQTPSNGPAAALAAAQRYGATHLITEPARPRDWEGFGSAVPDPRFQLLTTSGQYLVYRILP